jgi:hypothetical protein
MIVFPLETRSLIRGCAEHITDHLSCAADYVANYAPLYSPVDGPVYLFEETQGGLWIQVTDAAGRKWEMAHLSERYVKMGDHVHAGQLIGKTGNTGQHTTGPHLHLQVIVNYPERTDPVPLLANVPLPMPDTAPYEGFAIIRNPGGQVAYVKHGQRCLFQPDGYANIRTTMEHYLFVRNSKFVSAATFDAIPLSTETAAHALGEKTPLG